MFFMILAYQNDRFSLSDVGSFNKKWGRNPDVRWRNDLKACIDASYFASGKPGRKRYHFLTLWGRVRLEGLLKEMYQLR